jgi:hypothetical protein
LGKRKGVTISARYDLSSALILPIMEIRKRGFAVPGWGESFFEGTGSRSMRADAYRECRSAVGRIMTGDAIGTIAVTWPEFHPPGQYGQQPDRLYPRGISQAVSKEKSRR